MRTVRPKQALILTDEERDRLQSLAHRARIRTSWGIVTYPLLLTLLVFIFTYISRSKDSMFYRYHVSLKQD